MPNLWCYEGPSWVLPIRYRFGLLLEPITFPGRYRIYHLDILWILYVSFRQKNRNHFIGPGKVFITVGNHTFIFFELALSHNRWDIKPCIEINKKIMNSQWLYELQ
jgi:hypothetical protein